MPVIGYMQARAVYDIPAVSSSERKDSMYNSQQKYTRWGAVSPGAGSAVLMIGADWRVVKMFGSSFTKCGKSQTY
jgi:hypothetical protein